MSKLICDWTTYKGNHCKKLLSYEDEKSAFMFCDIHRDVILRYSKSNVDELCEKFTDIKVSPRSYQHLRSVMNSLNNEDDTVQVYLAGGLTEEADISNEYYISLNSDNSRFYYNPKRGQRKSEDLKIMLRKYCQNNSIIKYDGICYCEECYKNLKDVPRISLVTQTNIQTIK